MFDFGVLLKYVLEGLAVALAAFYIPRRQVDLKEIVLIALTAAAVFSILDQFSPTTGLSARQGAGFGIGLNQVGFGNPGHYHGFGYLGDYPYDHYGGQDESSKLSCTCEVDADYLRGQICQVHTPPNGNNVANEPSEVSEVSTNVAVNGNNAVDANATAAAEATAVAAAAAEAVAAANIAATNATATPLGAISRVNVVTPEGTVSLHPAGANVGGAIEGFDGFSKSF